jgi:hypothetical protein
MIVVETVRDSVDTRTPISHNQNTMLKSNSTHCCTTMLRMEVSSTYWAMHSVVSNWIKWDEWWLSSVSNICIYHTHPRYYDTVIELTVIIIIIYVTVPVTTVTITPTGDNNVINIIEKKTHAFTCSTDSSRPAVWM